jgi:hypothetical protein
MAKVPGFLTIFAGFTHTTLDNVRILPLFGVPLVRIETTLE